MTADAGLAQIAARFSADAGISAEVSGPEPDDPMARLVLALQANTKAHQDRDRLLLRMARAAYPVPVPAMAYTVSGGTAALAGFAGGSEHLGPRTGYFWDLTRISVDGLTTGAPIIGQGNVTSPGAGATIASIAAALIVPGTYTIQWTVGLSGTLAAADIDNFRLRLGSTALGVSNNPDVAGTWTQPTYGPVYLSGANAVNIIAIGAATAGAIYQASIDLVPAPADTATLYKRFGAPGQERLHTFTAPGTTPGPDWQPGKGTCMMRPGDALQLVATSLAATQLLLSGEAIQVEAAWIGKYLL